MLKRFFERLEEPLITRRHECHFPIWIDVWVGICVEHLEENKKKMHVQIFIYNNYDQ